MLIQKKMVKNAPLCTVNPGSEMIGALYISNFDIFCTKMIGNHDETKKFDILHCPFEKNAI